METSVNNKCKAFTSLEQSRKLAKILPIESADACWTNHLFSDFLSSWRIESTPPQEYKYLLDKFIVKGYLIEPAWSLAALLDILSKTAHSIDEDGSVDLGDYKNIEWSLCLTNTSAGLFTANNPVDACYEMIIKLHELKML